MHNFCVYTYSSKKGNVKYVGKGKGNRPWDHMNGNSHNEKLAKWTKKHPKASPEIVFRGNEQQCLTEETRLIRLNPQSFNKKYTDGGVVMNDKQSDADNYPTPPWVTRALFEHVIQPKGKCWEPACGQHYMSDTLEELGMNVKCSDRYKYSGVKHKKIDFLEYSGDFVPSWIITNPPFKLAEEFVIKALEHTKKGVAIFIRASFLESIGRYDSLFRDNPPSIVAQFVERPALKENEVVKSHASAFLYTWIIWEKGKTETKYVWIPPCKKTLERSEDYE